MGVRSQSSAAGILALLSEPEPIFKQHALNALNPLVPRFWAEISEHIALMSVSLSLSTCSALTIAIVNHSTRATSSPRTPEMSPRSSLARSTIISENTMNLCPSPSVPETRLKQRPVRMDRLNTSRLSSVSNSFTVASDSLLMNNSSQGDRQIHPA